MSCVDWTAFFQDAGISSREAKTYAAIFAKNNIGSDLIQHLDKSHLKDMGIIAVGDVMRIMLSAKIENVDRYITRKNRTRGLQILRQAKYNFFNIFFCCICCIYKTLLYLIFYLKKGFF